MARYKVTLYGQREVETMVIVDADDEEAAQIHAEYLAACDERGIDLCWQECEGQDEITEVMADAADEVDPTMYRQVTRVRSTRPGRANWRGHLHPASATRRALLR